LRRCHYAFSRRFVCCWGIGKLLILLPLLAIAAPKAGCLIRILVGPVD
jgi:hypothetical protein